MGDIADDWENEALNKQYQIQALSHEENAPTSPPLTQLHCPTCGNIAREDTLPETGTRLLVCNAYPEHFFMGYFDLANELQKEHDAEQRRELSEAQKEALEWERELA